MSAEWLVDTTWQNCREASIRWGVAPLVAQLLHNRGLDLGDDPQAFLAPRLADMHPPELLPGATQASELLAAAVTARRRIVLYGDYDVDGITGLAILWRLLSRAGADVGFYVPHRLEEGYGLNPDAIRKLADEGAHTVVSVDCGITGLEAARLAADLGLELIVTDHHCPRDTIPQAAAVVHPTVGGQYPNPCLCGAGVAFKLAWETARRLSGSAKVTPQFREVLLEALPLAALGTIADVVSLTGENRIIARHGLARLGHTTHVGLLALIESAGLTGKAIGGYEVGFRLAPRINAAGRMGHARLAVELLTRADADRSREIALYLEEHNKARQAKERKIVRQACDMVEQGNLAADSRRAIVLASEGWHAGVIGIVAARLVDRYRRPTVLIALENGLGQGSARSIAHFELDRALSDCSEHLVDFGGHAMAAGLKIESNQVDAFAAAFVDRANNLLTGADLQRKLRLEAEVALTDLDLTTAEAVISLGPFGVDNPKPLLATGWVELAADPRCVGKAGEHLQVSLREGRAVLKGIAFGKAPVAQDLMEHRRCRVAFEPIINDYRGRRSPELRILDFQFPA
ncbi:MAG: single-stranded-DNA-specific exonuclease RecJ [bacterium]|nr:single-stranded-DNA-specific exonuclease RecJ [bacterium]